LIAGDALEGGREVSFVGGSEDTDGVRTDGGICVAWGGSKEGEEPAGKGPGVLAVLGAFEAGRLGGGGGGAALVAVSGAFLLTHFLRSLS
jgi:hypothetical protein